MLYGILHSIRRFHLGIAALALLGLLVACSPGPGVAGEGGEDSLATLDLAEYPGLIQDIGSEDSIGSFYRNGSTRKATLAFFSRLVGSDEVARIILDSAESQEVSPSLAFALAYVESKFEVSAMNRNADSVDRGLFQLNSKSFPKLTVQEFYDPAVNAKNGIGHLRFCLDRAGNEVAALAMYNAGHGKVSRGATPLKTLDYVYRVLKYEERIAELFEARVARADRGFMARLGLGFAATPAR